MKSKILIVDDEPLNQTTLEAFLAGEDYELHFAEEGYTALALAQVEQPDLILLDVMMPEMDGFEVTRRIRADPAISRIPIILITALDDDRSRLEGLQAGADDFLTKPCRRDEIRARVRTVASLNRFRSIAEERARFEQLFQLSPGGIVLVDHDGIVIAANPTASRHAVGTSVCAAFGASSAAAIRKLIADTLAGAPSPRPEIRLGEGTEAAIFHLSATVVPEDGLRRVMLVFADVTAEVQAREALEQMNANLEELVRARTRQLEESNGLLMSYANFVSHDLRSPLTVVKGYLSLLQEGAVPLDEQAAPLISQAYQGTLMMQELIQNILQLARDEHDGTGENARLAVDPTPVIRRMAMRMNELFPKVPAELRIEPLPEVGVSAILIERVFYNLLTNAFKYSAGRKQPRITIGARPSDAGPLLFVSDNGVGFDARDSDKLFREFTRLGSARGSEGFGLGLSLVARLLRAHGGRIWAESTIGEGATFFVQLPPPAEAVPGAQPGATTPETCLAGSR